MNYRHAFSILFFWLFVEACAKRPSFESYSEEDAISCSPTCSMRGSIRTFYGAPCSCSESCLTYGDCCRDAPYQNTGKDQIDLGCLTLDGLGPVSVVSNCPSSLGMEGEACAKGLETSIPVTSLETGISYSSLHCAQCNNDSYSLVDWPVELRCCSNEGGKTEDATASTERMQNQNFGNDLEPIPKNEIFGQSCDCRFYARNDLAFALSLELRKCGPKTISTCSSTWSNENTRILCSSYFDPVYNGENVYRNSDCATCNFENIQMLKCLTLRSSSARQFRQQKLGPLKDRFRRFLSQKQHSTTKSPGEKCDKGQKIHPELKMCVDYHE